MTVAARDPARLSPAEQAAFWRPLCMDDDEWGAWRELNGRVLTRSSQASRPCRDCTLGFAAEMRAAGRCNGTPAGAEVDDEEDTMDPQPAPHQAEATTLVQIALAAAPCAGCTHSPVCRLRPDVEALTKVRVAVPAVSGGVHVELAGQVSCDHYTRARTSRQEGTTKARDWSPEQRARQAERMRALNAGRAVRE